MTDRHRGGGPRGFDRDRRRADVLRMEAGRPRNRLGGRHRMTGGHRRSSVAIGRNHPRRHEIHPYPHRRCAHPHSWVGGRDQTRASHPRDGDLSFESNSFRQVNKYTFTRRRHRIRTRLGRFAPWPTRAPRPPDGSTRQGRRLRRPPPWILRGQVHRRALGSTVGS